MGAVKYHGLTFYVTVDGVSIKVIAPWIGGRELLTARARDMSHRMMGTLGGLCFEKQPMTAGTLPAKVETAKSVGGTWMDKAGTKVSPGPSKVETLRAKS